MSGNSLIVPAGDTEIIPFGETPSYLAEAQEKAKAYATTPFSKEDYTTPRIYLLQGLSPQITLFPGEARIGHFWHGGMNVSLGETFNFVTIQRNKRVILWRPRADGGGMLARSINGIHWDMGANQEFEVTVPKRRDPVIWRTGANVPDSGLTQYGSSNPDDDKSPPAAHVNHEYLLYVIGHPELSPVVYSVSSTGLKNSRAMNRTLDSMMLAGRPYHMVAIRAFVQTRTNAKGTWTIPNFATAGFIPKNLFDEVTDLAEKFKDYTVEPVEQGQDEETQVPKYETAY